MDWVLYLSVPLFVIGIGILLLRRRADPPFIGVVSNRTLGILAIAIGAIDFVIRLLRSTVMR